MSKPIRVMVVDDSALVRQTLSDIFSSDPDIEVMAAASDPYAAVKKMESALPDVLTLDIEMPRMDGLTFLRKIMSQNPIPVIICSTLAGEGSEGWVKAMEYGAVDVITKPKVGTRKFFEESRIRICDAVKAAASAKLNRLKPRKAVAVEPNLSADAVLPKGRLREIKTTETVVAVGASTGGTEALRVFLEAMPENAPGIVIVQHMPEMFTAAFSQRLNTICRITVREAVNNDTILRGQALIAPGNKHMLVKRSGARSYVEVKEGPLVRRHRPSVDVLFRSAARYLGKNAVGVIMTGMGDDGAQGMLEMRQAGAFTIAQDEATCVVYGMPGEAVKLGGVEKILPLERIPLEVVRAAR
ncbi:protein-glutamate methylesterase/protein-glutamine glutaminase [Desulfohalovibrio reitneri]|uniref:protein-glutamate methylesterase/protein-glutamine glutaminase n=1 Tax=Desulfohalovibrio reitneri TaxID=1307759 RepID=UPI0004A6B96B|nr:chemotaxis response regulator protein-glutamate methylesterase [Desulfohalovibrio reitneri]